MPRFRSPTFERSRDGGVVVRLGADERALLGRLVDELRGALLSGTSRDDEVADPLRRLFPVAHPQDPEAEAGYRSLMRDDLLRHRLEALDEVESLLDAEHLGEDQADVWMAVLNDLRLVLGTILDVGEDDDRVIHPDDPDAAERVAYAVLTQWLDGLVEARAGW